MKHGGDILSYQHLYDGRIIDFSSNINPLGYPKVLDTVIPEGLHALTAYPDIQYRTLRQAIARYLGCHPAEVIVGNGAVEILDHFCRDYRRTVTVIPCFAEYIERPGIHGKQIRTIQLPDDFTLQATLLEKSIEAGDLLLLGNPNNPTGRRIEKRELVALQHLTENRGAFLLLDEAFFEFCAEDYDSIQLFYGKENVCVIRAATKFFALPGARLGYACASKAIVRKYNETALPWRINAVADLAGSVIFQEEKYIRETKHYLEQQRQFMLSQLQTIDGLKVYPTDTNFILLKLVQGTEDELFARLIRHGVLIRKASSFEGLDNTYIRVAIKDRASNTKLLHALRQELSDIRSGNSG